MRHHKLLLWGQTLIEKGVWNWVFAPISLIWQGTSFCRNFLYHKKWLKIHSVRPVVVSIGNIIAGGTGKTPFALLLAKTFSHRNVAFLTKGYGGDEEKILAKQAKIYVGKDRVSLAKKAEKDGVELLIIDDGFQYRSLHRDVDVVLLREIGNGHFLPWGFLRDSPKRLKEAHFLFQGEIDFIWKPKTALSKKKVGVFAGIANPHSFKKTLINLSLDVIAELRLADHETIDIHSLNQFASNCKSKDCEVIVTTEKDFVKLPSHLILSLPLVPIEIELQMIGKGEEKWKKLVAAIEEKLDNRLL